MIKFLLIIPIIGCIIAAASDAGLKRYRDILFDVTAKRLSHSDPRSVMRSVNVVLSVAVIIFIFLWPIIVLKKLIWR